MPSKNKLALAISMVCLQSVSILSIADENAELDSITVIGSVIGQSTAEDVRTYAGNRTVVSAEDLDRFAVRSIDDALQRVPGIKIQDETGTGVLPNVAIRGLNASRSGFTQFLLDGVPLTLAPYGHTGQSLFPAALKSVERIDIVRGGAAVQYGPNNVGGVINIVSKAIPDMWQTSLQEKITAFSGGNFLTDTYIRTGGAVNDDFSLQFEGNIIDGESFREHSDTSVENWMLKTHWNISSKKMLGMTVQRYDANTEMPGALTTEAYQQDRQQSQRLNDEFAGDTTRFSVHYNQQVGAVGMFDAAEFDWTSFGHDSTRNFQWDFSTDPSANHWAEPGAPATLLRSSPREFRVWGTEPRVSMQFNNNAVTHKFIIGTRLVKEDIDYKLIQTENSTGITSTPRDWMLDTTAIAAYISDEISLLDQSLTITPGMRYENVDMNFKDLGLQTSTDNSITELLPSLTIGYEANENWFLYANSQRSLRAPQIASIRGTGEEGAELAWNYEVGTRIQANSDLALNFAFYHIDFTDQLLFNSTLQSFDNVGETRHQGLELEGHYSPNVLPTLTMHMAYNFLDSEQLEGSNIGKELPYASKHQLIWDASYSFSEFDMTLSGFYFSSAFSDVTNAKEDDITGTKGKLPSYTVWNLKLSTTIDLKNGDELYLGLSANNLFNDEYYFRGIDVSPSGRYPAPPRSVSLELTYTL